MYRRTSRSSSRLHARVRAPGSGPGRASSLSQSSPGSGILLDGLPHGARRPARRPSGPALGRAGRPLPPEDGRPRPSGPRPGVLCPSRAKTWNATTGRLGALPAPALKVQYRLTCTGTLGSGNGASPAAASASGASGDARRSTWNGSAGSPWIATSHGARFPARAAGRERRCRPAAWPRPGSGHRSGAPGSSKTTSKTMAAPRRDGGHRRGRRAGFAAIGWGSRADRALRRQAGRWRR